MFDFLPYYEAILHEREREHTDNTLLLQVSNRKNPFIWAQDVNLYVGEFEIFLSGWILSCSCLVNGNYLWTVRLYRCYNFKFVILYSRRSKYRKNLKTVSELVYKLLWIYAYIFYLGHYRVPIHVSLLKFKFEVIIVKL